MKTQVYDTANQIDTTLSNYEKDIILKLLEKERFRIMQHALKVKREEGHDLSNWAHGQAKIINGLIVRLKLNHRVNDLKGV